MDPTLCLICFLSIFSYVSGAPHFMSQSRVSYAEPRVVNGTAASRGLFPFMVALRYKNRFTCGASIVNERWIMTAAHCVYGREYSEFSILAGTTDLHGKGSKIEVVTVLPHEKYDPYDASNDIAVLKLKSPLTYSEVIQPVDLPSSVQMTPEGLSATVIGWGLTYTGGRASTSLQYARLETYSDEDCYRLHKTDHKPKPTNLCAGTTKGGKGQCSGDSGGPLMVNGYQAGIVSWSIKPCASSGSPGVFTEVSYFVDWVKDRTWSS